MLTQADNGKTIEAQQGSRITVTLPENPTTGYSWGLDGGDEVLSLVSSNYVAAPTTAAGGGGNRELAFEAKSAGMGNIRLKRWRPWEGESSVRERYTVAVRVRGE